MRKSVLAVLALATVASAAPALAQQQFPDFDTMDANHDGKVTKEEFMASLTADQKKIGERVFAARDANKDGVITRDELAPAGR